jgi:hypothetical protein
MGRQFVGLALPREAADTLQATVGELVEVALDAPSRDVGQAGDVRVGEALAFEPQDLHLLLNARMRMTVAVVADRVAVFGGKRKVAHGRFLCS